MQTAYKLDPLSPSVNNGLARIYHFRNENDKVVIQINKTLALDSNYAEAYFTQGINYFKQREYQKAEPMLQKAVELSNGRPVIASILACNYAKEGKTDSAQKILSRFEAAPPNDDNLYAIASIKLNVGQVQEGVKILEQLIREKYGIMVYFKVEDEFFDTIDEATRQRLEKEMGF